MPSSAIAVVHLVRQPDRRRERDHVAAEQRQLHAVEALRDPVAHRRCRAGDLAGRADLACVDLQLRWIGAVRLVSRDGVVVGADNPDVRPALGGNGVLVLTRRGKAVRKVRTRQGDIAVTVPLALDRHQFEVPRAARARPLDDPLGDPGDGGMEGHDRANLIVRSQRRGGAAKERNFSRKDAKAQRGGIMSRSHTRSRPSPLIAWWGFESGFAARATSWRLCVFA
jgi:hypothetical protein